MRYPSSQNGEGKLGCMIWLVILAAVLFVAWKTIPVKVATSRLNDAMVEEARTARRRSPAEIRRSIVSQARALDLPVQEKNCQVAKNADRVDMACKFTVPIEFPGYVYNWDFDLQVRRTIFQF